MSKTQEVEVMTPKLSRREILRQKLGEKNTSHSLPPSAYVGENTTAKNVENITLQQSRYHGDIHSTLHEANVTQEGSRPNQEG